MILLVADTLALVPLAAWLAGVCRPRGVSAWCSAVIIFGFAEVVVISEAVGRVAYTPGAISAACAGAAALGMALWWARPPRWRIGPWRRRVTLVVTGSSWPVRIMLAGWIAIVAYSVVAVAMLPPTVPDVLRYHLPMAVRWVQEASIGAFDFMDYRAGYLAHNVELLNGWCLLLSGSDRVISMPQVVLSGILWPLACFMALRGCSVGRRAAVAGALLASMTAPVVLQMRNEMVDAGFYAVFVLGLVTGLGRQRFYRRPWLVFAAAAGLALGSKSSGVLALGVLGVAWSIGLRRQGGGRVPWRAAGIEAAWLAVLVPAIGGWVYGANLLGHGNPFFPIALKIGPVALPTTDDTHPIYYTPWVHDFGESPLERIAGGVARWPRLFLSLPPFHRFRSAGNGGFGYLTTATLLAAVAMLAVGAVTAAGRARLRRVFNTPTWTLLVLLMAWNILFLAFVSLITVPYSLVDARYQIHLALVFVVVLAGAMPATPAAMRAAVMWVLAAVFLATAAVAVYDCPQRGWKLLRAVTAARRDRLYPYTGRPIYIANDPAALLETLGDEPLMVLYRGWTYPFYYPSFERAVYPVSRVGADERQVNRPDLPDEIVDRSLANLAASKALIKFDEVSATREWREANERFAESPDVAATAVAYWEAMAERYGVRYLYVAGATLPALDASLRWRRVMHEQGRNEQHEMTLYVYDQSAGGGDMLREGATRARP